MSTAAQVPPVLTKAVLSMIFSFLSLPTCFASPFHRSFRRRSDLARRVGAEELSRHDRLGVCKSLRLDWDRPQMYRRSSRTDWRGIDGHWWLLLRLLMQRSKPNRDDPNRPQQSVEHVGEGDGRCRSEDWTAE